MAGLFTSVAAAAGRARDRIDRGEAPLSLHFAHGDAFGDSVPACRWFALLATCRGTPTAHGFDDLSMTVSLTDFWRSDVRCGVCALYVPQAEGPVEIKLLPLSPEAAKHPYFQVSPCPSERANATLCAARGARSVCPMHGGRVSAPGDGALGTLKGAG